MSVDELVAPFSEPRQRTVEALRTIVRRVIPDALEAVRPGWGLIGYRVPVGKRAPYFGFIWPELEHVHLGFEYGIFMDDPRGVLLGSGRKVRWVTLTRFDELPNAVLEDLVKEGARVATLTRTERVAALIDRDLDRSLDR